jgi:nanoRNase/pAp phosphatase (c-di-AMP/oligoRNAs hydrolase)
MSIPLCYYHRNCFDGTAAALVVSLAHPDVELVAMDYTTPVDVELGRDRLVYIVDFSMDINVMIDVFDACEKMVFLDHHEESENRVRTLQEHARSVGAASTLFARYRADNSGAVMAYDYMLQQYQRDSGMVHRLLQLTDFLKYVQDRDLWLWRFEKTKAVMTGLGLHPYDPYKYRELFIEHGTELSNVLAVPGQVLIANERTQVQNAIAQTGRTIDIFNHTGIPLFNVPRFLTSEVGAATYVNCPFVVCYYDDAENRVFSLRSRKDGGANVKELAEQYGGGGHHHAAGFSVPRDHPLAQI